MIPKIIHQIYFDLYNKKIDDIAVYKKSIEQIKLYNPTYKHMLWNKKSSADLIKKKLPQYYDFYINMRYDVQRIDFLRFVVLYVYGGFYVDLDLINLKSLDKLLHQKFVGYSLKKFIPKHNELIQNDFFGAEKKFKLFKILMDLCEPNYNTKASNKIYDSWKGRFVLQTTGPRYVSKIFKKILPKYKPQTDLIYTKWRNDIWKQYDKNDFYFENYVTGGWLQNTSDKLKNNNNFYLKENEI
jgi:mannosyltransferase OCH1-like enzyme